MAPKQLEGWNLVDEDARVLWREYSFTKGARATTLVFRGTDGLVVVSPGRGLEPRALDALRELGEVRALVANNDYHHMGQAEWRARFPDALSYCPAGAVRTLAKKVPSVPFRPVSELAMPEHARCDEVPGFKTGEVMVSVRTKKGAVWYSGDLLTNIERLPGPPLRWIFTATDSAPGFRLFRLGVWLLVKDKRAVRAWALERLAAEPPAIVVPGHGAAVEAEDVAAAAKKQLERL